MTGLLGRLIERLPLDFRVLYRQFMLRVIDLEALSIEADVERFLGQFAGVLIMISLISALGAFFSTIAPPTTPEGWLALAWHMEQSAVMNMMLVVGLLAVIGWDATFPDRRDVMVLSPLPVAPRTILLAKVAASGALVCIAVVALNGASGFAWPLILGTNLGGLPGFLRLCAAWWFTVTAASAFLYCSVLTVQGFTALLLPRRIFLRLSAILQLAAFGLFLAVYFIEPSFTSLAAIAAAKDSRWLACSPAYWFFALLNQMNGSWPAGFSWLAWRAWIGLGTAVCGAAASLFLCYKRTMKKTVEEPDLVPGARGWHWTPRLGTALQTAILVFSFRSLTRSRQHRVVLAFYFSVVFGLAISLLRYELSGPTPLPVTPELIIPTILMMAFSVIGLRNVFPLPISLTANWVLRTTQVCPSEKYIAATRRTQLLFAVLPVWIASACLSLSFRPWIQVAEHLAVLALLGFAFAELSLIGFYKVPFTCSYLPGKSNIQVTFWGFVFVLLILAISFAPFEQSVLDEPLGYAGLIAMLGAAAAGLWVFNNHQAKAAVLYFDEPPDEVITTLGLVYQPQPKP
jgi:hypothetical protein